MTARKPAGSHEPAGFVLRTGDTTGSALGGPVDDVL
jgi:hypothetical protein